VPKRSQAQAVVPQGSFRPRHALAPRPQVERLPETRQRRDHRRGAAV